MAHANLPVKYIIYSHYSFNEGKDFDDWERDPSKNMAKLEGVAFLLAHLRGLSDLLNSPGHEGLAVLFYAPGLEDTLDSISHHEDKSSKDLLAHPKSGKKLRFATAVESLVMSEVERLYPKLRARLRLVTALDLFDIFSRVKAQERAEFRRWFFGVGSKIHYDTPKIVEAIVRLRLLGNGLPVFRLDWDVLFGQSEACKQCRTLIQPADLGLFKAVATCERAYRLRLVNPSVGTFLFSASYDTRAVQLNSTEFDDWRGAFATRVFPALPVVLDKLIAAYTTGDWDSYAQNCFSASAARRFYGLKPSSLESEGIAGLPKIGAHPVSAVISGAFLCISDGAILDLPPFSNFSVNVSWIDDHLKYCLHYELHHLTAVDLRLPEAALSDAKLDEVMMSKWRQPIQNLPKYLLNDYLPTLLMGTVMDRWINAAALSKFRRSDLSDESKRKWDRLPRAGLSKAPLSSALQRALETGDFTRDQKNSLKQTLKLAALERINEVQSEWSLLTDDSGHPTFASIWARGVTAQYFSTARVAMASASASSSQPSISGEPTPFGDLGPLSGGIPVSPEQVVTTQSSLNRELERVLDQVIEDAADYIDWTLHWPKIVHVVRSIEPGTVKTDLAW